MRILLTLFALVAFGCNPSNGTRSQEDNAQAAESSDAVEDEESEFTSVRSLNRARDLNEAAEKRSAEMDALLDMDE